MVNHRNVIASLGLMLVVTPMSACTPGDGEGTARNAAESVIAYQAVRLQDRIRQLRVEGSTPTAEDLRAEDVAPYIATEPSEQTALRDGNDADVTVYEVIPGDGLTAIAFYIPADGTSGSGITLQRSSLFSCGLIRYPLTGDRADLEDVTCPDWLQGWRGDKSEEVSLVGAIDRYGERWRE